MKRDLEHIAQKNLLRWAAHARGTMPELDLLFAIPNGGLRNMRVAVKLKAEGVKAGVPDLFLPVSRSGFYGELDLWSATRFNGLFIEMKVGKNKPTKSQKEWHEALRLQGYAVEVCYGWEQAKKTITTYLHNGYKQKQS